VGVPVPNCDVFLVEEGKVQDGWPVVVDSVGGGYVSSVCEAKICSIADVD